MVFFILHLVGVSPFSRSVYAIVNLTSQHPNVIFAIDSVYFLEGVAYDFYSLDELNDSSKASPRWQTFPLAKEPPSGQVQRTTGLAFVEHIYIITAVNLVDRQANLERMFARHQIKNYEWRQKWKRDTCFALENQEEVHRKLNLRSDKSLRK